MIPLIYKGSWLSLTSKAPGGAVLIAKRRRKMINAQMRKPLFGCRISQKLNFPIGLSLSVLVAL